MPTLSASPGARDPWLDNTRFVLICLVVFGHLLEPLRATHPWFGVLYAFIYTFHMPAFAFLSGAVSHASADARLVRSVAFGLLLPYLVFQGLYAAAAGSPWWPGPGPSGVTTPYWLLWYLLSLACWRILLPLFAHLRHPLALSVAVALLAGIAPHTGYYLSLSRTLVFFPLFLLGWRHGKAWRRVCCRRWARPAGALALAAVLALVAWLAPDPRLLYGSYNYASMGLTPGNGVLARLLALLTAGLGTLALLALAPRGRTFFSGAGGRSLGAYVLQGFCIKFALGAGLFGWWASRPSIALALVLAVLSVALAYALSSRTVQRLLRPLTRPRWLEHWLWLPARAPGGR